MKVINLLYRSGAGGEFFGGLLTEHPEIASKSLRYDNKIERWFLEREDYQSDNVNVTRNEPRIVQNPIWKKDLWNVRLDHGFGFGINQDFWTDYLWNEWDDTKTILFVSFTRDSLDYTVSLAREKLVNDADHQTGQEMIEDGILDVDEFWNNTWLSQAKLFDLWMDTMPENHSSLIVDPFELLHGDNVKKELKKVCDYLEIIPLDNWEETIESYRVKNRTLINNSTTELMGNLK